MYRQLATTAARGVAVSAILAIGLGSASAAQAASAVVHVPCDPAALAADVAAAGSGTQLSLAPSCVYRLTAGLPVISQDLTISGHRATLERSYAPGTPAFTILHTDGGTLTVGKLNFRNGSGAIAVTGVGALTVNGGTFTGNTAVNGGAISDIAGVHGPQVNGATFTANTATGSGGAIYDDTGMAGVQVTDSTFTANTAANAGGAIFDFDAVDDAVTGSVFTGNTATSGGALFLDPNFQTTLSGDVVTGNTATGDGGGITSFFGLDIENSRISGNQAGGRGGGLFASLLAPGGRTMTIDGTDFQGNSAADGGGIYDSLAQVTMDLTNVRISGNHVSASGGGVYNTGAVDAVNTRIVRNSAAAGGGIFDTAAVSGGNFPIPAATFTLTTSQVLRNRPDNCEPAGSITGCAG
jgi:hypothetical protein